jgi:PBP1b-binding outer membrane lipoprotein LpoB
MKKIIIASALAGILVLAGCSTATEPVATVTETVTAQPSKSSSSNSSSSMSVEEEFILLMSAVGTPSWMLEGEALDILIGQAKDVCSYISQGDSKEDITWIMVLAADQSNASEEVVDAFLGAAVAGTYTYCPQHEGFWD